MEMTHVLKYFYQLRSEICWLNNNKGNNDEYVCALHGSVEHHVGGADQQELEQQGPFRLRDCGLSVVA